MSDDDPKRRLARAFHAALAARDWTGLRALIHDDASWTLPGENTISGRVCGGDAVVARARQIASYGQDSALERILASRDNVALSLHNTAQRDGVTLDEHLTTVCRLRDGRIAAIETYLSDVTGMNAFFV